MAKGYTNPANAPNWRALCEELLGALENEGHAHWPGGPDGDPLIEWTRIALARPEPEVVGPSDEELLATLDKATADFPPRHPEAEALSAVEYPLALELRKARAVLARWGNHFASASTMVSLDLAPAMRRFINNPVQIAECGGPCADGGPEACDCGALARPEPEVVADGPAVPESREPAAVVGEPSDEELLELMPETMRDEFSYAAKACSDATGSQVKPGIFRVCLNTAALEYARAVLARWGNYLAKPDSSAPAPVDPPLGPFSEHDLRQQWNQQADEFNQWDSLDSCEQLAWAQVCAIAALAQPEPEVVAGTGALPCPFCGQLHAATVEGDTFRWLAVECPNCLARGPEVRVQTAGDGSPAEWRVDGDRRAIKEWNTRWGCPAPAPAEPEISAEEAAMIAAPWSYLNPPQAGAGEVVELVAALRNEAIDCACTTLTSGDLRRIADLLEQRQGAPVPVPVSTEEEDAQ